MAQSKATKKFEKRHLKDTLKRRKDFSKVKQRHKVKEKSKARKGSDDDSTSASGQHKPEKLRNPLEDMTVDDFFAGGFDIAKNMTDGAAQPKRSGKRKHRDSDGDTDEDASVESVEDRFVEDVRIPEEGADDDFAQHKGDLQALSEKDPEFFKYLQENDPELLDMGKSSNFPNIDALSDENDQGNPSAGKDRADSFDVSKTMVKRWSEAMEGQKSLRAMREVVLAFRAAVNINEETDKTYKYTISNADAYHELLLCALRQIPTILAHHIPVKRLSGGREVAPTDNKKFRALSTLIRSHVASIQHLLENLSDSGTTRTAMASVLALVPFVLSFKKLVRDLARTTVELWSDSAQDEATRISGFLILQCLTKNGDPGIKDTILRTTYQGLLKGCRNTSIHTIVAINLMKNTAMDLWASAPGKDGSSVPYTTAFTFIRSLALHLRNCIKRNANEAYKAVYNWQYVHALDFWSRVLSTHCASLTEATAGRESPLKPLIYPLVQVTIGAMRLIPTAAYFPLRFHCIRALLRLSAATNTFVPLAAPLYEVLISAEMRKPPHNSTLKPLDFDVSIRASQSYLRTRVYQDGVGEQVVELLSEFFTLWCKNIAFPELTLPVVVMLRRWLKEVAPFNPHKGGKGAQRSKPPQGGNRNNKLNSSVSLLIQKLDANAHFVEAKRAKVDFAPNDRGGVEGFLKEFGWRNTPLGAFVEGQRKAREERRRVLEEARKAQEAGRAHRAKKTSGTDFDADGIDVDGNSDNLDGAVLAELDDSDDTVLEDDEE